MQASGRDRPAKKELWFQCGRYFARTIRRDDASERWAKWLNDPWVVEALNLPPRALTKKDIVGYIRQSDQRTHLMLGIFERGTRVHVGIIRIDLDHAAGEALVNAIIGEPEHRNRGATTDAFVSTLDFLFDIEGMARVRASVLARNNLTLQYLLKMGWELDEAAGGELKSSADGSMLDVKSVVWTRESYRAFRLTRLGKRILRRLADAEKAAPSAGKS
jgi:RimJ/RimL family protein N-acetyltransferase